MSAASELLARPITLIVALGIATLLPFAFMTLTAFVKISTVLQIVRGAIGAQNVPSNAVIMAFAGALTLLAMAPLGTRLSGASPTARRRALKSTAQRGCSTSAPRSSNRSRAFCKKMPPSASAGASTKLLARRAPSTSVRWSRATT